MSYVPVTAHVSRRKSLNRFGLYFTLWSSAKFSRWI